MKIAHSTVDSRGAHAIGRELLAELYLEETGEPLPPILIQDRGKPCFAHGDWHFSITHTRNHVFCVLSDVPVFMPVPFEVNAGDACLVIFADRDIDAWFESGEAEVPPSGRMHSLSDGFAFVGFRTRGNTDENATDG